MGGDWWYSPSTQAQRLRFSASRLEVASSSSRLSQAARTVLNQRSIFSLSGGLIGTGMDEGDAELGADQGELL